MNVINELLLGLVIIVLIAFIPSLIYLGWIRNIERFNREPWKRMGMIFLWGAMTGVVFAAIIEMAIIGFHAIFFDLVGGIPPMSYLMVAVVIAPMVEEGVKGYGITLARGDMDEVEDGMIYGAACGLGFASTENILYMIVAFQAAGLEGAILIGVVRAFSSTLLHASAAALTGYGISRHKVLGPGYSILTWYLAAVIIHALYNLTASIGGLIHPEWGGYVSLLAAVSIAIASIEFVRRKIHMLDIKTAERY